MSSGVLVSLDDLAKGDRAHLLGLLTRALAELNFTTQRTTQTRSWESELACLQQVAQTLIQRNKAFATWHLLLEYEIPRRQKRPDGILLDSNIIFVIEFKLGESRGGAGERWQAAEYALDLRDFHADSSARTIIPILCVAKHSSQAMLPMGNHARGVWPVSSCGTETLAERIIDLYTQAHGHAGQTIDARAWRGAAYRPTLTIIEAAEQLFGNHNVQEISHSYASNLTETTNALVEHVREAQRLGERRICFVTGVPGAGKTLTGLNAVHDPALRTEGRPPAVFLSGNGPLVKVIRTALIRNAQRQGMSRTDAARRVGAFIQNVHAFLRHYTDRPHETPLENVVVFDEAQRAWDVEKMRRAHKVSSSEPELVLDVLERCRDWCVLIALVGGGQEIHEGEAGLAEWGRTLLRRQQPWIVVAPEEALIGGGSVSGHRLFDGSDAKQIALRRDGRLHLKVSTRSWRAHRFNEWVNNVLSLRPVEARSLVVSFGEFPVVRTRSLAQAREWLRAHSRMEQKRRCGLVASSGAIRLRAYGVELSTPFRRGYPFEEWFLAPPEDVRSSFHLEVAGTEFEVQGLELDWVGLCWGNDFHVSKDRKWVFRRFTGRRWSSVRDDDKKQFILNKYRVLLTRARQGLVLWVPPGVKEDPTLDPSEFDAIFEYLGACGVPELVL